MHNEHFHQANESPYELILFSPFGILIIMYIFAAIKSSRRHKSWSLYRTTFWILGVLCIAVVSVGPLANRAHTDFTVHMIGHLLLGMFAPLLIVLSAPITLVLRTLNVKLARLLSSVLKSSPIRILNDPIVTSFLNVGGLWILYTTDLYSTMHQNIILYFFIHLHVFISGYLFTASMIYIDPTPHRTNFIYRSIVLVIALAGHGILSKYIYAQPPSGVPITQAEIGGMLMYYGGDAIDIILIFIFCLQWYRSMKPRTIANRPVRFINN